jgi:hypothetical protein
MPRLTSLTERITAGGSQRSPIVSKVFTGTDFSASHSTWSFGTGTISLFSSTLPYHSYGNAENNYTITPQFCNKTWPLRAGTNVGTSTVATTTGTNIGYWINGVNMYNPSAASEAPNGYLSFTNLNYNASYDAALNFSYSLNSDAAGGHWDADGAYRYHDYTFKNAWLNGTGHISGSTGTVGTAEVSLISYISTASNSLVHADGHSKILGWSLDGYPVYGPYGYTRPTDYTSGVTVMTSGYSLHDLVTSVPERVTAGVIDDATYPLGIFVQDFYYAGGKDLDISNGRYCVTPEYPQGTYAYFVTLDPITLKTAFPYVIGNYYKSTPVGPGQTTSDTTNGGGSAPKQTS